MATEVSWKPVKETACPIQSLRKAGIRSGRVSIAARRASLPARADHGPPAGREASSAEAPLAGGETSSVAGGPEEDGAAESTGSASLLPICPFHWGRDDGISGGRACGWAAPARTPHLRVRRDSRPQ